MCVFPVIAIGWVCVTTPASSVSSASILNKLTPEKFDKLCLELLNVGVDSKLVLKGIILLVRLQSRCDLLFWLFVAAQGAFLPPSFPPQIVDKALEEPKYSSLYAQLCLRLAEDAPNFDSSSSEIQTSQKQSTVSVGRGQRSCSLARTPSSSLWCPFAF